MPCVCPIGLTLLYMTARTPDSQTAALQELSVARQLTDQSLADVSVWPGSADEGEMFRADYLFAAVLDNTRSRVKTGDYFWKELDFYTNIIDTLFGWLVRRVGPDDDRLWRWLVAYSYLMASINYMGAEQALCGVFHSLVCFSHRETFRYANYSFSGEAAFRLYRQTYPESRQPGWRLDTHRQFFPQLMACRDEIVADMDYVRISVDPSSCDFSRKNETRVHETALLLVDEHQRLKGMLDVAMEEDADSAIRGFLVSVALFAVVIAYYAATHVSRCVLVRTTRRRSRRRWKATDVLVDDEKIVQLTTATPSVAPDTDGTMSLNHDASRHNHDTSRHNHDTLQHDHDTLPQYQGTITPYQTTLPQYHGTLPKNHGILSNNYGTRPNNHGDIQGTFQKNHRTLPHNQETLQHNHGTQQHNHGTLPHNHRTLPHDQGTLPPYPGTLPKNNSHFPEMVVKVATV
ncbi:hypothetical protein LSAT2_024440 [Lamellibrachia satsuma]|nr:hypothetical protein LSAT2_024440 [Lamellibrachia satsuma]